MIEELKHKLQILALKDLRKPFTVDFILGFIAALEVSELIESKDKQPESDKCEQPEKIAEKNADIKTQDEIFNYYPAIKFDPSRLMFGSIQKNFVRMICDVENFKMKEYVEDVYFSYTVKKAGHYIFRLENVKSQLDFKITINTNVNGCNYAEYFQNTSQYDKYLRNSNAGDEIYIHFENIESADFEFKRVAESL